MLKDIRLHLDEDEEQQNQREQQLSELILTHSRRNQTAFSLYMPSLMTFVDQTQSQNISLVVNKLGQLNMVDFGSGRVFYGAKPDEEIARQYDLIAEKCLYKSFSQQIASASLQQPESPKTMRDIESYEFWQQRIPMPEEAEVVVVLGLGKGEHIKYLLENHKIKHLIIYEPEVQYFKCSTLAMDWTPLLEKAASQGTAIYMQLEKDGRDLLKDMLELHEHTQHSLTGFYLYRHYNHPIFNAIETNLCSLSWSQLQEQGFKLNQLEKTSDFLPSWTQPLDPSEYQLMCKPSQRFNKNLQAFEKYMPKVAEEFSDYQPADWFAVRNSVGQINIIHHASLTPWYGDSPKQECETSFAHFQSHPNKDDMVLGYKRGKHDHYLHVQYVAKTQDLLNEIEGDKGKLPDDLQSLIVFGIGVGYQLESLFAQHKIENLFLCEPNRDFFYASLHAIDWADILAKVDDSGGRLFINVGDAGDHLFRDLLSKFYAIGPYMLANTYFYQGYYNSGLVEAVAQLREQLQVVISVGEYYDHSKYGIAHTSQNIIAGCPMLVSNPESQLQPKTLEVPVFVVGNGPSLDTSIEIIKRFANQAIIVSCGTALMSLYRQGITPDFHAEIEQNRATHDWVSRIGDPEFLQKITLISCNGIHPDTMPLFKDTYIAFKAGESSSFSALKVLGAENYHQLEFAFPTVSNFVVNLFATIGMNVMYFFGLDLGFADQKKHHSQFSGYYKDGKEIFDYVASHNASLVVPGNFRSQVFTKYEFKMSKTIIEQSLENKKIDCYNCSDGAKIEGSNSLLPEHVLITTTSDDKREGIEDIKSNAFFASASANYKNDFTKQFNKTLLEQEFDSILDKLSQPFESVKQAEEFVNHQRAMLLASYEHGNSLFFYYMYGTSNHANAVFVKLAHGFKDETKTLEMLNKARQEWRHFVSRVLNEDIQQDLFQQLDVTYSEADDRVNVLLEQRYKNQPLSHVVYFEKETLGSAMLADFSPQNQHKINMLRDPTELTQPQYKDWSKVYCALSAGDFTQTGGKHPYNHLTDLFVVITSTGFNVSDWQDLSEHSTNSVMWWMLTPKDTEQQILLDGKESLILDTDLPYRMTRCMQSTSDFWLLIPKRPVLYPLLENREQVGSYQYVADRLAEIKHFVNFPHYLAVPRKGVISEPTIRDNLGSRGQYFQRSILPEDLYSFVAEPDLEKRTRLVSDWVSEGS
jgi:hypothetical protein